MGLHLEETVKVGAKKARINSWISSRNLELAELAFNLASALALSPVNGQMINKVSHITMERTLFDAWFPGYNPLRAKLGDIKLDIVFEDEHLVLVNNPAHMVVHLVPRNHNKTLVNAILHHRKLPIMAFVKSNQGSETKDFFDLS